MTPDSGDLRVFGKNPAMSGMLHQKRIGYIFQDEHIEKEIPLSVMDVISVGRMGMRGIFKRLNKIDKYAIETAMKEVGIYTLKDRPAGFLSGGEQRKVSIAREISREVEIVLLDEILMNLDPVSQMEINNLISKIYRKYELTIIFVTHLLHYLPDGINRIIALKDGKVFWEGKPHELNIAILTELYGCPKEALKRYVGTFKIYAGEERI